MTTRRKSPGLGDADTTPATPEDNPFDPFADRSDRRLDLAVHALCGALLVALLVAMQQGWIR